MESVTMFYVANKTVDFSTWMIKERESRGWSQSELARRAHLNRAVINNIENGRAFAGQKTISALAKAFGMDPATVFRAAGLLPPVSLRNRLINEIVHQVEQLPEEDQEEVLEYVRMRARIEEEREQRKKGRSKTASTAGAN